MAVNDYAFVNKKKLDASLQAESDAIRAKDGTHTPKTFDLENGLGFSQYIMALSNGPLVGFEVTTYDKNGYPTSGKLKGMGSIPANYFSGEYFTHLEELSFEDGMVEDGVIGAGAFSGCAALLDFDLRAGAISSGFIIVRNRAFENCVGLTDITVHKNIEEIAADAFSGCANLTEIYCDWVEGDNPSVEANAPWGATNATVRYKVENFITFSSPSAFHGFSAWSNGIRKTWDGTLEYSYDGENWTVWDGANSLSGSLVDGRYVLCLRGTNNTVLTGSGAFFTVEAQGDISCRGNMETLLDYRMVEKGQHPSMGEWAFHSFFGSGGFRFKLVSAPRLGSPTLARGCYMYMYKDCSRLIEPSKMDATTLAINSCMYMYQGCTSLEKLNELPVGTLPNSCYQSMYSGCSGIAVKTSSSSQYSHEFRIPSSGSVVSTGSNALKDMFANTSSDVSTPTAGTVYYVANEPVSAS